MGFGTALMKKLKQENMTLKELSEKTGIPTGTLYPIARGEEDPTMDIVARIDKAFRERFTDYDEDIFILKTGLEIKETIPHLVKAYETAIVAMQELQQYKRLGDLKKVRNAVERRKAKPPMYYGDTEDGEIECPHCRESLWDIKDCGFDNCPYCGQKLDWSEEDD